MDYKLIFVEGLPGTGKTTLSERIYRLLVSKGVKTTLLLEDDERIPCNFYCIAGIPKNKYMNFSDDKSFITETENYFYINMNNFDNKIKEQLQPYDIGDEFNKAVSLQEIHPVYA